MIYITPNLAIDDREIQEEFIRSSGPGGQNVNKVATGVQLRFDVANSPSLPDDIRERLLKLGGRRLTADGILVIDAHRFRTQAQNREDALRRLVHLIFQATQAPVGRRHTQPGPAAIQRRLDSKRRRGQTKRQRRNIPPDYD